MAWLPESFSISLGRTEKTKDGRENDIIVSMPFISRGQLEIVRSNGRTVLRDLNSTNGTFVNGERVKEAELHTGDEISVWTVSILYDEEFLRFKKMNSNGIINQVFENDMKDTYIMINPAGKLIRESDDGLGYSIVGSALEEPMEALMSRYHLKLDVYKERYIA